MCLGPLTAYYSAERGRSGKRPLTFARRGSFSGVPVKIPCGQCMECRLEKSRMWALRCMNEKRLHRDSAFITLTYGADDIPTLSGPCIDKRMTLEKRDLQLFMKRLRHEFSTQVRFFACGEYGETFGRPHYHVLLLSHDFADKKFFSDGKRPGEKYYKSATLDKLWGLGHTLLGDVTFDSCAYVARYVTKKITGSASASFYAGRQPEFAVMSRKPGLGRGYYDKYVSEIYGGLGTGHDSLIVNGKEVRPPRYYDELWKIVDPVGISEIKEARRRKFLEKRVKSEETSRRRRVREIVAKRRMTLRRSTL